MNEKNKTDRYVDYINIYILPFIDYHKLQDSYDTDMIYAKGILNCLHEAMVKIYGGEQLDEYDGDSRGCVFIPGIVRGIETGKLCLVFLDIDLSAPVEHYTLAFLCKYGVVQQDSLFLPDIDAETKNLCDQYMPYDYCYTAGVSGDIHINKNRLPEGLKAVLKDFRNHKAELLFEHEELAEKPSTLGEIKQSKKDARERPPAPKKDTPGRKKSDPDL